jgi:hypothetical protein
MEHDFVASSDHVDMSGPVIVRIDDHAQSIKSVNRGHQSILVHILSV